MFSKAIIATALISAVSAHQNWHQLWINDETPGFDVGIRMPASNSPVRDITSDDMACNEGGSKVPSGVETVPAKEGDTIKVQWDQSGHPGPITHFLYGPVDDASQATGIGAGWFKIDELNNVDGEWASEIMGKNNMTHEFKLPTGLATGEYLLRSEMEALHGAQTLGGAEFYIGCAQLKITGTGKEGACGPTIELPGAYKEDDDNVYIPNVYNGFDASTFKAPGGPIATCDGSAPSNSTAPAPAAPANSTVAAPSSIAAEPTVIESSAAVETPVAATSSVVVAETSAVAALPTLAPAPFPTANSTVPEATTIASSGFATLVSPTADAPAAGPTGGSGPAKKYYQCGGSASYTGPTTCAEGLKCVVQNEFYSQCLDA